MVDEVDERRQAGDGQDHTQGHGDHWHEIGSATSPNGGKDKQAIHKGGEKRAKHDLIAAVAHEIAQHSGAKL